MENEKKQKISVKIENDQNGLPKDLEIQDSSLNIDSTEERPGIGIEIFGVPGK